MGLNSIQLWGLDPIKQVGMTSKDGYIIEFCKTIYHLSPGLSLPARMLFTLIGFLNKQLKVAAFLNICPP